MHYFIDAFKKYAVFSGRSRRAEFWCFYIVNLVISYVLSFLDTLLETPFSLIYALVFFIPSLALAARRFHDVGKSGWTYLWALTGIGIIYLIVLWARPGDIGENAYGQDPKIEA